MLAHTYDFGLKCRPTKHHLNGSDSWGSSALFSQEPTQLMSMTLGEGRNSKSEHAYDLELHSEPAKPHLLNHRDSVDISTSVSREPTQHIAITLDGRNDSKFVHDYDLEWNDVPANETHGDDSFCARIQSICKRNFRSERWYRDDLFFILAFAIAIGPIILPLALEPKSSSMLVFGERMFVILPIGFICLVTIPLCGIVHSLQNTPPSQRHFLSAIRLIVDPGRAYRISRWIYFILCPITAVVFSAASVSGRSILYSMIPAVIWYCICLIVFFSALLMSFNCIWSGIFA